MQIDHSCKIQVVEPTYAPVLFMASFYAIHDDYAASLAVFLKLNLVHFNLTICLLVIRRATWPDTILPTIVMNAFVTIEAVLPQLIDGVSVPPTLHLLAV